MDLIIFQVPSQGQEEKNKSSKELDKTTVLSTALSYHILLLLYILEAHTRYVKLSI